MNKILLAALFLAAAVVGNAGPTTTKNAEAASMCPYSQNWVATSCAACTNLSEWNTDNYTRCSSVCQSGYCFCNVWGYKCRSIPGIE